MFVVKTAVPRSSSALPGSLRLSRSFFAGGLLVLAATCSEPQDSGESHVGSLLLACSGENSCAGGSPQIVGLDCHCAACTVPCAAIEDCQQLAVFKDAQLNTRLLDDLVCREVPGACTTAMADPPAGKTGVCDVACTNGDDCLIYGSGFHCLGGYCRREDRAVTSALPPLVCPSGMVGVRGNPDGGLDLCVDTLEVTTQDYQRCVADAVCPSTEAGNAFVDGREKYPIDWVSPEGASAFCEQAEKRLPTRVEWQWAAQNGAVFTRYPWGDVDPSATDSPPRVCALGTDVSCPVGSFPSGNTSSGVADLAGNVGELVLDGASYCAAGGDFTVTDADLTPLESGSCTPFVQASAGVGFRCVTVPQ